MTGKINVRESVPLNLFCTLGIGGPARYFTEANSIEQLREALAFAKEKAVCSMVLGKGSNLLFDDRGYNGLVILNKIDFLNDKGEGVFEAGAGYSFSRLGVVTARGGWGGLEFASGIPGTVGGALYMNAGANGGETCDTLLSVEYLDEEGELHICTREALAFGYRTSSFQEKKGALVSATFRLKRKEEARSEQLALLDYRIKTQPYSEKSAGCIFRNPSREMAAGALIEQCGLKGYAFGGAVVSELHGNFLINKRGATGREMAELIAHVKQQVADKTGIVLESEVRFIPYEEEV